MLVRLAPGVDYPPHRHAAVEELHLLYGELLDRRQKALSWRLQPGGARDLRSTCLERNRLHMPPYHLDPRPYRLMPCISIL